MKATELRIGNLIYNTRGEVDTVNLDTLKYLINYPNTLCQAKPISLTKEWLLRFGFKTFQKDWSKKNVIVHSRKRGFIIRKSIPQIEYVHQLQNLYFVLTGEELTIKQPWNDN